MSSPQSCSSQIPEAELRAWAYLTAATSTPCPLLVALIEKLGVLDAAAAVRDQRFPNGFGGLADATARTCGIDTSADDLAHAHSIGARLVTPAHDEWPTSSWESLASHTFGIPVSVWVCGTARLDEIAARSVAIVGSRAATGWGMDKAAEIAGGLAAHGWATVSDGGFGIAGAAHRGCLDGAALMGVV